MSASIRAADGTRSGRSQPLRGVLHDLKKLTVALLLAALAWPALAAAEETAGGDPEDMKVFWKRGLRFETADGRFEYRLGGDVQANLSFFTNNDTLEAAVGDIDFPGLYVFASYFVTGEHRIYNRHFARFDGVEPRAAAFTERAGTWELAARYSYLDASDSGVRGGNLQDGTLGVNWYLNYNSRVMFN